MKDKRRVVAASWIVLLGVGCVVYSILMFLEAFGGSRSARDFWIALGLGVSLILGGSAWSFLDKRN